MKNYLKPCLGIWMFALLLLSLSANAINPIGTLPDVEARCQAEPVEAQQRSLNEVLNPDGTLKQGIDGSFNAQGFKMGKGKNGQPVFLPSATLSDDDNWSTLGTGLNGFVYAVAVSGTKVYVGGGFTSAGGTVASNIALWNGSTWSALGTGVSGTVYAIAVSGANVYVGGQFTSPGNNIALWNGSTWSAMGAGVNSVVYALVVSGTKVYAGGGFNMAGGGSASRIALWNGSTWSALGTGLNSTVYAIAVSGTNVYAGGGFSMAGGNNASRIALWNGSSWSALSTGLSGAVYAITVSGTNVYVGGNFTGAGGNNANRIALWNGSSWSALGLGVNNSVRAITVSGTNVYVGGEFTMASSGTVANRIALWNGSSWSAFGSGVNSDVRAIVLSGTNTYVGGFFTTAGNKSPNYIAAYHDPTLPVRLLSYTAKADGNYAKLQWQTANEVNNKGFEVWRAGDDGKFVKIGFVSGVETDNYLSPMSRTIVRLYTDYAPLNGNNYYKLVQIDNDGKATELGIKTVTFNFQPSTFNLYPNPATHSITLNLGNKKGTLIISDALGRAKTTLSYNASAITIDISAYPSGVYFYQLGSIKGKFIKQ